MNWQGLASFSQADLDAGLTVKCRAADVAAVKGAMSQAGGKLSLDSEHITRSNACTGLPALSEWYVLYSDDHTYEDLCLALEVSS